MAKIIAVGLGAYVDAEQIVAIDNPAAYDENRYSLGFEQSAESTILLKNGDIIPGYVKPETIRKRWQEAVEQPIGIVHMTAKEAEKWKSRS